jgi:hypothetical protein
MRLLIVKLWLGHFVISVLGKKILLTRYFLTNAIVYSCVVYSFSLINVGLMLALVATACCIACLYFSFFYFYWFPPRWAELDDVQKWYCGSQVIRGGCKWILDDNELSMHILEWDRLDRYYISLTKI